MLGWASNEQSHGRSNDAKTEITQPHFPESPILHSHMPTRPHLSLSSLGSSEAALSPLPVCIFWNLPGLAQGHLSLCEFLCIPIALRFGLFNSLQTKHLERQHRGQHPLSFAPLPPSSSLSQQMLLTEAMLCALIISYGNSLSLSIKYL